MHEIPETFHTYSKVSIPYHHLFCAAVIDWIMINLERILHFRGVTKFYLLERYAERLYGIVKDSYLCVGQSVIWTRIKLVHLRRQIALQQSDNAKTVKSWFDNRGILKKWKEDIYTPKKKKMYQGTSRMLELKLLSSALRLTYLKHFSITSSIFLLSSWFLKLLAFNSFATEYSKSFQIRITLLKEWQPQLSQSNSLLRLLIKGFWIRKDVNGSTPVK